MIKGTMTDDLGEEDLYSAAGQSYYYESDLGKEYIAHTVCKLFTSDYSLYRVDRILSQICTASA